MYRKNLLQLMLGRGVGDASIKRILKYIDAHPETTLEDFCNNQILFLQVTRLKECVFKDVLVQNEKAEMLFRQLTKENIHVLTENDGDYPAQIKKTLKEQCPPVLFAKGNLSLLSTLSVGFCGSRKVSPKGIEITEQCAEQLIHKNMTVVSGYAPGTDTAAHTAAIATGGNTIFVLAEGILSYKEKASIKKFLSSRNHLFISQFAPNASWSVGNAMKRNSLIIGLSGSMILVESGRTGGTFAAGEESLKRGVPLFVIDYLKPEVSAEANPYFIERGGLPIRGRNGVPNLEKVFSLACEYNSSSKQNSFQEQMRLTL